MTDIDSALRNILPLTAAVDRAGHLTVGEGAIVYAQSGIGGDVEKGARVSGSPAFAANEMAVGSLASGTARTASYSSPP